MTHKLTNLLTQYRNRNPNPSQQQTDLETVLKVLVNYIIHLETEIQQLKSTNPARQAAEIALLKEQILQLNQHVAQLAQSTNGGAFAPPQVKYASIEDIPRNLAKPKPVEELVDEIPQLDSGFGLSETELQSYLKRPRVTASDIVLTEQEKAALQPKKPEPSFGDLSPLLFRVLYFIAIAVLILVVFVFVLAIN